MGHGSNGRSGFVMECKEKTEHREVSCRIAYRCPKCKLIQYAGKKCVRCQEPMVIPDILPDVFLVKIIENVSRERVERCCPKCGTFPDEYSHPKTSEDVIPSPKMETRIPTMEEMEKDLIVRAMYCSENDGVIAAKMLGIGKTTLYRKLKQMGIKMKNGRLTREKR